MIRTLRSALKFPVFYTFFGWLIGGHSSRTQFVHQYVTPSLGSRILDIGCGPGTLVAYLPQTKYTGFDISSAYIHSAKSKYGHLGKFYCQNVVDLKPEQVGRFDIVLVVGVIHHLNDLEARTLFESAYALLKSGGKLVTFDGVFVEEQTAIARYIIAQDRGQYVRTKEGYLSIASQVFSDIKVSIRHDLLRIPYTHLILECFK